MKVKINVATCLMFAMMLFVGILLAIIFGPKGVEAKESGTWRVRFFDPAISQGYEEWIVHETPYTDQAGIRIGRTTLILQGNVIVERIN